MGYDYEISYKQGKENVVANGLSRIQHEAHLSTEMLQELKSSWQQDINLQHMIKGLEDKTVMNNKYKWENDVLTRKGKLVVGNDSILRTKLISQFHDEPVGGHSGV